MTKPSMLSAFSMLRNQAAQTRAKLTDSKTNYKISFVWKNYLIIDVLARKINLKISLDIPGEPKKFPTSENLQHHRVLHISG